MLALNKFFHFCTFSSWDSAIICKIHDVLDSDFFITLTSLLIEIEEAWQSLSLILLPLLDCNKQIFMSDSFVEFIYKNYDIDAFDHCQFLFDAEELILQDEMIGHYHVNIRKCKSTFFVNKNLTYEPFNADERKMNLRFHFKI